MKNKTSKHNFSIEKDVWKKFKLIFIEQDKTATEIISDFIKDYVKKYEERKIRQKK